MLLYNVMPEKQIISDMAPVQPVFDIFDGRKRPVSDVWVQGED